CASSFSLQSLQTAFVPSLLDLQGSDIADVISGYGIGAERAACSSCQKPNGKSGGKRLIPVAVGSIGHGLFPQPADQHFARLPDEQGTDDPAHPFVKRRRQSRDRPILRVCAELTPEDRIDAHRPEPEASR